MKYTEVNRKGETPNSKCVFTTSLVIGASKREYLSEQEVDRSSFIIPFSAERVHTYTNGHNNVA